MNIARTAVGCASLDGVLYTVGGECALADTADDTLYLHTVEVYDPARRRWDSKPGMKLARSFVALAAVRGCLYAIGLLVIAVLLLFTMVFFQDGVDA